MYVAGSFARAGGVAAANVAVFRAGVGFTALGSGLEGPVTALAVDAATGDLYAAETVCVELPGLLDCAQTRVRRWDGVSWTTFAGTQPGALFSLVLGADGSLYGAGSVADAEGSGGVVRWTGSAWEALGGGVSGIALALFDDGEGGLIAAGAFETAGGVPARNIARWDWDGASWSPLGDGLENTGRWPLRASMDALSRGHRRASARIPRPLSSPPGMARRGRTLAPPWKRARPLRRSARSQAAAATSSPWASSPSSAARRSSTARSGRSSPT